MALLLHESDITAYCAARRLSWASFRWTNRIEDEAYCLLGLFQINLPLLYGERRKAFERLQQEILRVSGDVTLFAWEEIHLYNSFTRTSGLDLQFESHDRELPLMASRPAQFARSGHVRALRVATKPSVSLVPGGVLASIACASTVSGKSLECLVALDCFDERFPDNVLSLSVQRHCIGLGAFEREAVPPSFCVWSGSGGRLRLQRRSQSLKTIDMVLIYADKFTPSEMPHLRYVRLLETPISSQYRIALKDTFLGIDGTWIARALSCTSKFHDGSSLVAVSF